VETTPATYNNNNFYTRVSFILPISSIASTVIDNSMGACMYISINSSIGYML